MTPNKALSEQQYHIIRQNLPAYYIRALTGADNVDKKWTTQELWTAFLTGVHVVVGTPAVLADALTHGFVPMSRLSLLVFDECHRCIKKDPMNKIMQNFYHPAKHDGDPKPHVLALSALPVMNRAVNSNSLPTIESNLDATTVTPTQYRDELDAYVHPPKLIKVEFGESCLDHSSTACRALGIALASYDFEQDPYVLELQARSLQGDPKALRSLQEIGDTGKTYCKDQLKLLSNRARHINNDLEPEYADWYISTCVTHYPESRKIVDPLFLDLETKERRHLEGILKRVVSNGDSTSASTLETYGASNKAKALLDILSTEVREDLRSIIFVEQRAMVLALAQLLRRSAHSDRYRIGTFVGTSTFSGRASSLFDLFDVRSQAQDLKEFRDGSKNLMIATNVLEEGIDIPACNRVICFDLPKSLISFVQRRGRARQADSCYMLFVPRNDLQADPARWQGLEEEMKKAYMDEKSCTGRYNQQRRNDRRGRRRRSHKVHCEIYRCTAHTGKCKRSSTSFLRGGDSSQQPSHRPTARVYHRETSNSHDLEGLRYTTLFRTQKHSNFRELSLLAWRTSSNKRCSIRCLQSSAPGRACE